MTMTPLEFATARHHGQIRKYTGEPYINHPIAVAELVRSVPHTEAMIAAAYLHDVIEDCNVKPHHLSQLFGVEVGFYVWSLSDKSKPSDGNRAARKKIDREFLAVAQPEAKTIKLADLIDNTKTIADRDPKFWEVYREEKRLLLEVLREGDPTLWAIAARQCGVLE